MKREDLPLPRIHRDPDPVNLGVSEDFDPREVLYQRSIRPVQGLVNPKNMGVTHRENDRPAIRIRLRNQCRIQPLETGRRCEVPRYDSRIGLRSDEHPDTPVLLSDFEGRSDPRDGSIHPMLSDG